MRFSFAVAIILAVTCAGNSVDLPFHSKPWICSHAVKKEYNNAIWNGIITPGVHCFDDLLALHDEIKDRTPIKSHTSYLIVGPYIGKTKSFRFVAVLEDELEYIDLGTKIEDKLVVECFKCMSKYYCNNIRVYSCKELTMEECPERLSGQMYWNPPGKITSSSDDEFCLYRNENDKHEYICTIYGSDLDRVS